MINKIYAEKKKKNKRHDVDGHPYEFPIREISLMLYYIDVILGWRCYSSFKAYIFSE